VALFSIGRVDKYCGWRGRLRNTYTCFPDPIDPVSLRPLHKAGGNPNDAERTFIVYVLAGDRAKQIADSGVFCGEFREQTPISLYFTKSESVPEIPD